MNMKSKNKDISKWENVFYIVNLNGDGFEKRIGYNPDEPWYNLNLQPNDTFNELRHSCVGCSCDINKMFNMISNIVSRYSSPSEYYDSLMELNSLRPSKATLYRMDLWYDDYGYYCCDDNKKGVRKAISKGLETRIIGDSYSNICVQYNEKGNSYSISGQWAEWFEDIINNIQSFDGHTKKELFKQCFNDIDAYSFNEILLHLKEYGCSSISKLKALNIFRLFDILVPLFNTWYNVDEEEA